MSYRLHESPGREFSPTPPEVVSGDWVPVPADPALAERVRAALRTPARARGCPAEPLCEEAEVGGEQTLSVPVGLLRAVRQLGWMAAGSRPSPRPAGDPEDTNPGGAPDTPARFVASHPQGLIRYHPARVDPSRLVLGIVRAFSKAAITVLVARRADAISLARFLRRYGVDAFWYVGAGTPYLDDRPLEVRVAVATVAGLAGNPTELEKQDLILALDAVEAAGRATREVLLNYTLPTTKLFGLVSMGDPPAGADEDWVRVLFGFEVLDVLATGLPARRVEVTTVAAGGRRLARAAASDLELRRYGVWSNDGRNRRVARIARAVAARDVVELRRLGAGAARLPGPGLAVVQVENLEHALKLLPKLDGWALAAGPHVHTAGLGDGEQELMATRRQVDPAAAPGLVATPAGLAAATGYAPGIKPITGWAAVVRADAGDDLPPVPDDELVGGTDPLLVFDLTDDQHPHLRESAADRRRAYVEAGWRVDGVYPTWARVAEFVRRRAHLLPTQMEEVR